MYSVEHSNVFIALLVTSFCYM